jgi:hypothetical protein
MMLLGFAGVGFMPYRNAWLRERLKVADRVPETGIGRDCGRGVPSLYQVHGSITDVETGDVEFRRARLDRGSYGRPRKS